MISYDKKEIKEALTVNDINEVLQDWGGEPMLAPFGIISATICHNPPGEGSKKLYYYENSGLFRCYTGCADEIFDVFELYIKVQKIQHNIECDLNEAVRAIAHRFGLSGTMVEDPQDKLKDWDLFSSYNRIQALEIQDKPVLNLKPYDDVILDNPEHQQIYEELKQNYESRGLKFGKREFIEILLKAQQEKLEGGEDDDDDDDEPF
jgi:hypothetical protein